MDATGKKQVRYTPEIAAYICEQLIEGRTLTEICQHADMPHRISVIRWQEAHPDFATAYARAREAQADKVDDMIMDIGRNARPETANSDRVRLTALQWRAARLKPGVYGDRIEQVHDVKGTLADLLGDVDGKSRGL